MPAERISMRHIKELLRLKYSHHLSHRQIARSLNLSAGVVAKYVQLARNAELSWPLPAEMDDTALLHALFPPRASNPAATPASRPLPDFPILHRELQRKDVTLQLLWEEYRANYPTDSYGYAQFCNLYRDWKSRLNLSMRQTHRAGDKLFIDYCGPTVPIINAITGEVREAQIFVAVMGASNYAYVEATWSQTLPDWIRSHTRAFSYFGGVTALLVPDNLKSGVSKACRYEPIINATYAEMAAHYDTAILPARPRKPRDKPKVENGCLLVERWILARLRHHTFFSLYQLNLAIRSLLEDYNTRPFKKLPGCRRSQFEAIDKPALKPLPATAYELAEWKKAKVAIDYHVEIDHHYYSVPHALVKERVEVRFTATTVEIFHKSKRVASHPRSSIKGLHTTIPEHMPKAHRAHLEWTPGRFLNWASGVGPNTTQVVKHLLWNKSHPEQGYRSCLGVLSLVKRYGEQRVEAGATRAVALRNLSWRSISSILKQNLDQQPHLEPEETAAEQMSFGLRQHKNLRGPEYYQ